VTKGYRKMNMVQILCTQVCKWKNETTPGKGGKGIKENDGGLNSSMIHLVNCKNFYKLHNVPPAQ
jgi:hypothetical protein